ncbi:MULTISPECIES: hypothetical protein [unclassified Ochrobactrum]|uniref:hypothetical protein n=1 Tax=unclassified Ochrobactrum TaxID=239106 RepID=UPI0030A822BC
MEKNDDDKQLPPWLDIRKRKTREIKPCLANQTKSEMSKFSTGSLWASTVLGGCVSFFSFRSAYENVTAGKMVISSQMGRLRSIFRWPDDWGIFSTIVGLKLSAGIIFLIATLYCLQAAFRSHDK